MIISSPDKLIGCAWRLLCCLTHHDSECVWAWVCMRVGSFHCVWMYSDRAWVISGLISMWKRACLWRVGGGCGDNVPQPGALRTGRGGWPALAALMTGTVVWKSSVRGLLQLLNPHVCLLRPHSEPRVPGRPWSPSCPGTRQRIKVAQPTSIVVWCLLSLGWLIRDIHSSIVLSCLPTWAQCRQECVCVCGVRIQYKLFVVSEDIWLCEKCVGVCAYWVQIFPYFWKSYSISIMAQMIYSHFVFVVFPDLKIPFLPGLFILFF